ncbi:hypothetical protein [Cytobacillus sp.]|uniref:hypothetical protein n=1 Tax=Cytobacillus sp. TaxID=2675269 RepID=UPI0028BED528|nr:hypothetical protein [Cytobacillus sp.]
MSNLVLIVKVHINKRKAVTRIRIVMAILFWLTKQLSAIDKAEHPCKPMLLPPYGVSSWGVILKRPNN